MSFYLWLILGSFAGPFVLSFDRKVQFYRTWKWLFPSVAAVALVFILWDEYFTAYGIWGFTPRYLQGIFVGHLPVEECLFFIVVPYACIFIYEVIRAYFPRRKTDLLARIFAFTMVFAGFTLGISELDNWYTASACIGAALLIIGVYFVKRLFWFGDFALAFLVVMVPFLIVNGMLTGAVTEQPVVWYSEEHITGLRILTIPVEDIFYNLCLLLPVTFLFELLRSGKRTMPAS